MLKKMLNSKKVVYVLMTVLVFLWGLEYIAAKAALETLKPLSLIFMKYGIGLILLVVIKLIIDRRFPLRRKDVPILVVCALFGEVLYFAAEYTAMSYLPVSVITIILAFVPCLSIFVEAVLYKNKPTGLILGGVFVCVAGVAMVIGADFSEIFRGKYIGYLLAIGAVISWNIYNFTTKDLSEKYNPIDLTLLQELCAVLLVLPYTLANLPDPGLITSEVLMGVLYLGIMSGFIGFVIYIKAIEVIGPTPCALFSNFLPVTSTFFGWILLQEHVSALQLLGGAVVIASGTVVIWQKGKMDEVAAEIEDSGEEEIPAGK